MLFEYTADDGIVLSGGEVVATTIGSLSAGGRDYIENGNAVYGTQWWRPVDATVSVEAVNGVKHFRTEKTSAAIGRLNQKIRDLEVGQTYRVRCDFAIGTAYGALYVRDAADTYTVGYEIRVDDGELSVVFVAEAAVHMVRLDLVSGTTGDYSYFTGISLQPVEVLGVDETTEYYPTGNAASLSSEADSVGAWGATGAALTSQSSVAHNGTWALLAESNTTPTVSARVYYDLGALGLVDGDSYRLSVYARHQGSGGDWKAAFTSSTSPSANQLILFSLTSTDTTFTEYATNIKYSASLRYLVVNENNASNDGGCYIDAISVKQSGNLVSNSQFYTEAGTAAQWTLTAATISGGLLNSTLSGTGNIASQSTLVLEVGETYVITADISGVTAGTLYFQEGTTSKVWSDTTGSYTFVGTFQATTGQACKWYGTGSWDGSIDNVSVRLAVTDSSSNADGLEVHDELHITPLNRHSNGALYRNATLIQPYSASLDTGVADFTYEFIYRVPDEVGAPAVIDIFSRGYYTSGSWSGSGIRAWLDTSKNLVVRLSDDGETTSDDTTSLQTLVPGNFYHVAFVRSGTTLYLYLNGNLDAVGSVVNADLSLSNSNAVLTLNGQVDRGGFCGFKVYTEALSSYRIKSDYESEIIVVEPQTLHTIQGESYYLEVQEEQDGRRVDTVKNSAVSESGRNQETNVRRKDVYHDISTSLYYDHNVNGIRKLLETIDRGGVFTWDQKGGYQAPVNPRQAYLAGSGYSDDRQNGTNSYKYALSLRLRN